MIMYISQMNIYFIYLTIYCYLELCMDFSRVEVI